MNRCILSLLSVLSMNLVCYSTEPNLPDNAIEQYKTLMKLLSNQEVAWLHLLKEDVMGRTHLIEQHTREWTALQLDMLTYISNKIPDEQQRTFQELVTRAILLRKKHMYEWGTFKQGLAKKASLLQEVQQQQIANFEHEVRELVF